MPPPPPPPLLTACFSELPAESLGTVAAGIVTFWLGLRGLTHCRSLRNWVENFPKPVKLISPPPLRTSVIVSSTVSTASPASRLEMLPFDATRSTNSCFATSAPLFPVFRFNPRLSLPGALIRLHHAVFRRILECRATPFHG